MKAKITQVQTKTIISRTKAEDRQQQQTAQQRKRPTPQPKQPGTNRRIGQQECHTKVGLIIIK